MDEFSQEKKEREENLEARQEEEMKEEMQVSWIHHPGFPTLK